MLISLAISSVAQVQIGLLKYNGGGDWYANPTAVPNLIRYCNENIDTGLKEKPRNIEPQSKELYNFPIVFLTGHGNVFFSEQASENLRNYLISGGFLHISDNYGLNDFIRKEMKKVFPELEFEEIGRKTLEIRDIALNSTGGGRVDRGRLSKILSGLIENREKANRWITNLYEESFPLVDSSCSSIQLLEDSFSRNRFLNFNLPHSFCLTAKVIFP